MVQATGKSHAGGERGGWLNSANFDMASRVKSEMMKPPQSGTAIARVIRQILPQVVRLFDLVDFDCFGILSSDTGYINIIIA